MRLARADSQAGQTSEAQAVTERDLHTFVRQHYDRLFRAARFMSGDLSVAEDLVQETFLAAAESLERFQGRSSAYTWLYGILLNKFRRWLRRRGSAALSLQHPIGRDDGRAEDLLESHSPSPGQTAERHEDIERVRAVMQELSADHRSVITLRFMEGLSYEEVARTLDCPVGTVKSRIHYALLKMGKQLGGDQDEGG